MDNSQLTDDEKRAKRLEQLAQAREKAAEKRRALGDITRAEKQAKDDLLKDRIKKLEMLKAHTEPITAEEEDEAPIKAKKAAAPKATKKKVLKKVIEVSDSSSDDSSESSDSDDEPQVEYIVRRTKKAAPKAPKTKGKKQAEYEEYDTPKLSAEVAKNLLKKLVMDDAQSIAFKSLFPYHNF